MSENHFKKTFRYRSSEWLLAVALAGWGWVTLISQGLFEHQESFHPMLLLMSQQAWGVLGLTIGLFRLLFLFINGAWRPSAHLRALGCTFGCLTWGMLLISTFTAPAIIPTAVLYVIFLSLDFLSLWFAAGDAKLADLEARERRK